MQGPATIEHEGDVGVLPRGAARPVDVLAIALQLALLLAVVHAFGLEERRGLLALTPLVLGGFVLQAFLPLRARMPFFLALSLAGFAVVLGPLPAARLVGIGLALIGVCHLRVPWAFRIAVLLVACALLTALRADLIAATWDDAILPIVGSIFMFRLVLYVYDLRTENSPATPWERLSYFFLLPNALFPLFPIIDWKAYRRTWFARDAHAIYAKGLAWMLRGVFHLLLYRLIYRNFTPGPEDVVDAGTLVLWAVSGYALYLRVSGIFHLAVGMLALFGFDLPETHHHYFLASGFNDLWRRINIYWKDFMMKIVYYPIFIRMRRRDATRAMVVATIVVFLVSWWLHSYQWFWILGDFPLTPVDAIFWTLFAALVLCNSLLQARPGAARASRTRRVSARQAAVHAAKVVGMFAFMSLFWAFWTGAGVAAWFSVLARSASGPAVQFAWLASALLGLVGLGVAWQLRLGPAYERRVAALSTGATRAGNTTAILALLWLGTPAISGLDDVRMIATVRSEGLNERDGDLMLRGYYEEILEGGRGLGGLFEARVEKPVEWPRLTEVGVLRAVPSVIEKEFRPGVDIGFHGARLRTNRWGLRDRDYEKSKPASTYRIALLGASIEMGSGVGDDETFENLVEDALALHVRAPHERVEILNFSVSGHTAFTQVGVLEQRAAGFEPDAVLFFAHPVDDRLIVRQIARMLDKQIEFPHPLLLDMLLSAGFHPQLGEDELTLLERTHRDALTFWIYGRLVEICREHEIIPVWVYLQHPPVLNPGQVARSLELERAASDAGFVVVKLDGDAIYPPDTDWLDLVVAPWDDHPNPEGHRRIAAELLRKLVEHQDALGLNLAAPTASR